MQSAVVEMKRNWPSGIATVEASQPVETGQCIDFRILGPLEVAVQGQAIRVAGPRQRKLLGMLLLSPGRVVSVDSLVEALWGDDAPATARAQVLICVAGLRKTFRAAGCNEEMLVTEPPGYRLDLRWHRLDAFEFANSVDQARVALENGRVAVAADLLRTALALWRGHAMAGVGAGIVELAVLRYEEQRLDVFEEYVRLRLELGDTTGLLPELSDFVREHPLREEARGHLMLALLHAGRRPEALAVFRDGRQKLINELGIEPCGALQSLHKVILRDELVAFDVEPTRPQVRQSVGGRGV